MDLENFLSSPYQTKKFEAFITDIFYGFESEDTSLTDDDLSESEKEHIGSYRFLGQVELDDDSEIGFFEFVSTSPNIENKRVGYSNILKKLAKEYMLDGAIASFSHPESSAWRLSFVGFEYDGTRSIVTNLKRYTYVLGANIAIKTPLAQLKKLKHPQYDEIVEAFSVERVSKEFFDSYKKIYYEICEYLAPQLAHFGNEKNLKLFVKKLLGRIVFLYFIEKKGWLGSDDNWQNGDKNFLTAHLNKNSNKNSNENFYEDTLQAIFFEALNRDRKESNYHFDKLDCKMPFLNGGLFSRDEFDKRDIIIENQMFKNIFDTFDAYNFTIIEDLPHDSEVAIDPEMLGRVFEDLLEDRKDKGAFYTPREIVHYMSKKSIENYLDTQTQEYKYDFSVEDFLHKTTLSDDEVLEFYKKHPVKFVKIDNFFTKLQPYKNLVIDFYIVAKLRGFLLNNNGERTKGKRGHLEITTDIWKKILTNDYEVVSVSFGSNREIKLKKTYKYPTILKYIKIEDRYFILAFLPNVWGDLELMTIFPTRYKEIKRKLKIFDKSIQEINEENFAFKSEVYQKIKELQEDCRSLHAEPLSLFQVEELPRQAVAQVIKQGLSAFYNSFTTNSLTDESLKALLEDQNYYNKFINRLLSNSTTPQDKLKKIMIVLLKKIKVLDPAIGSGAFPMGVLHEIIWARVHLGDKTPLSKMKREIIEHSIYGVDIEPSAVEIAKLRFWLSIVVDEDKPTPLPNLFYKIMVGNSLLETVNGFDPLGQHGNTSEMIFLNQKFHKFFNETNNKAKEKINQEIERNIDTVLQRAIKKFDIQPSLEMNKKEQKEYEANFEKYMILKQIIQDYKSHNATTQLFLYKIYFKEVMDGGGFDVVIGNPPYVRQEKIKELKSKKEIQNFHSYNGTADLYIYFFEKGYKLLKLNGILSYITSNKYTRAKYGKEFRKFVLGYTSLKEYVDFNGVKVFESATVDTSILTYQKAKIKGNSFIYCDVDEKYKKGTELNKFIDKKGFKYNQSDLSVDSFSFSNPQELRIKKQIEKIGTPLKDWDINIYRGITTGCNEAFIVDTKVKNQLIKDDSNCEEIIEPLLRGRDIKRYHYDFAEKWLLYIPWGFNLDKYPSAKKHLEQFKDKLSSRPEVKANRYKWYAMSRYGSDYVDEFKKEKIIWASMSMINTFSYTNKEMFSNDKCFILTGKSIKYLTAFLNSKLFLYYYKFEGIQLSSGYEFKKFKVENTPIKQIPKEQQKPFEILVDYVIFAKKHEMNLEALLFESIIDGMVYDLYFEEEMKKADCFISDEVTNMIGEFDSDNIGEVYKWFNDNKTIQRGLVYSRVISVVKVINGVSK